MIISRSVLRRTRNVSGRVVEKIKTHILCSINFFFHENDNVYEIMWKNVVEPDRSQISILLRKKYTVCMPRNEGKNTDAHS